jgi:hypothetical protein
MTIRPAASSSRIERSDRIIGGAPYLLGFEKKGEATISRSNLLASCDNYSDRPSAGVVQRQNISFPS